MDKINKLLGILEASPADSFIRHALALEYIKIGNEGEARKMFEHLLKEDPGYVGSYYHLGKLFERINEKELALSVYERGMVHAKNQGEKQTFAELKGAWEELSF